jgi:hypothetical protein
MNKILIAVIGVLLLSFGCFASIPDNHEQQQSILDGAHQADLVLESSWGNTQGIKIVRYGELLNLKFEYLTEKGADDYFMLGYCAKALNNLRVEKSRMFNIAMQKQVIRFYCSKLEFYSSKTNIGINDVAELMNIRPKMLSLKY